MACPYFYPTKRLADIGWATAPRLPLGDAYGGECRAAAITFQPDETCTRESCNVGYARGRCDRFPQAAPADAVRFHVAEDSGERIRIQYIFERDCWPREHGTLEYLVPERSFAGGDGVEILRIQAGLFLESYLRRRDEGNSKTAAV